jgi:hypothetical protein
MIESVDRVSQLSVQKFHRQYLDRSPVVMTDVMSDCEAMEWTVNKLRDRFAHTLMPVQMTDDEFDAFCEATDDPSLREEKEVRRIAAGERSFWVIELDSYFDAVLSGGRLAGRLPSLLDVPTSASIMRGYLRVLRIDTHEDWTALITALESMISAARFPAYLTGSRDYRFWFTPGSRRQGVIHADGYDNLNLQVKGTKEWILLAPDQFGGERGQIPNGEKSDIAPIAFPETGFSCATREGDVLYIPRSWWHAATAVGSCININAWHIPPTEPSGPNRRMSPL